MNIDDTYKLSNDIEIPKLGYGTFKTPDDESGVEAIVNAIELGYRHIDTAQGYRNEESVGKAIKKVKVPREELFITTKVTNSISDYETTIASLNDSLAKLDLDYIDLVLIHWPNPKAFRNNWQKRNEEVWVALEEFYNQGKIKALGISNFKEHHIVELLKTSKVKPMVNQIRICPGDVDTQTINVCRKNDILLEAYSPLGQGLVFEVEEIKAMANKYKKSVSQIVLRWSLQMGFIPLPKTVNVERMKSNIDLFDFELENNDLELLTNLKGKCGLSKDPDAVPF